MKLTKLVIQNFRGFEQVEVDLDPSFTLLVGGNGAGKTALLDAAAIALGALFEGLEQWPTRQISPSDTRLITYQKNGIPDLQQQLPVTVDAMGSLRSEDHSQPWTTSQALLGPLEHKIEGNRDSARILLYEVRAGRAELPLVAFYRTQRLWQRKSSSPIKPSNNRLDGYIECLDVAATTRALARWMKRQTMIELQSQQPHPQLAAVQIAIRSCIENVSRVWFDLAHDEIRLQRGAAIMSFSMLSEGYRNMVALVADLARRAAILNPQRGERACELVEGVVLIDELELHLHPSWQRRVVADLRRTFPKVQFIATTHSPQVVASVQRDQIRLLKDNRLVASSVFVEGRDSNGLLEDVFGVPSRPVETEAEISEIFRLLDKDDFETARGLLDKLRARLGPDDSAVVRADWVLDTEAPLPTE